jgi:hypothetical protein
MFGWTNFLDAGDDASNRIRRHTGWLLFEPVDDAVAVDVDDVLARDLPCLEVVPEHHDGLDERTPVCWTMSSCRRTARPRIPPASP